MTSLAQLFGLLIAAAGIVGTVAPERLVALARYTTTPLGLLIAAAFRIAVGVVLLRAAPVSRLPTAVRVLGIMILVAGLLTPLIGVERARALLDWWAAQGHGSVRVWGALAFAIGLFVEYAVAPRRRGA